MVKKVEEVVETDPNPPVLFVLMRTDLVDGRSGKTDAQSNHAGSAAVLDAMLRLTGAQRDDVMDLLTVWDGGRGFGTCIVKGCADWEMRQTVDAANKAGFHAGIIHDPTYPVRDGSRVITIATDTCGYVFGCVDDVDSIVRRFPLYSGQK